MPSRDGSNDDPIRRTILERRILRLRADQRGSAEQPRLRTTEQSERSDGLLGWATALGGRHGRFPERMARLARVIAREGAWALAQRQISRAAGRLVERT